MAITDLPPELAPAAVALWHECGLTRPWNDPDSDLATAMAGPSSTVLAAVRGDELAGTVMVGHDGHRGWMYYLAVRPDRRRTGVGRSLVAAGENWLRERGIAKLNVMVRTANSSVTGFYTALGYIDDEVVVLGKFLRGDARQ